VELQGRRLEDSLRGRQGRLLFAYLALNRDRPVRRDELAEALWSGKGTPPAYESLLAPPLSRSARRTARASSTAAPSCS
jgi:DNA-binding SARP family transcriptional activator